MELVIAYIIIAVILSMLTKSLFFVIFAGLTLFILVLFMFNFWFLYFAVKLLHTKPVKGTFVGVRQVQNDSGFLKNLKYKVAVYKVDEKECRSVFPAEGLFGVYFYRKNKPCRLRLDARDDTVFDRYNMTSCVVWPLFGITLCAAAVYALVILIKMRTMI